MEDGLVQKILAGSRISYVGGGSGYEVSSKMRGWGRVRVDPEQLITYLRRSVLTDMFLMSPPLLLFAVNNQAMLPALRRAGFNAVEYKRSRGKHATLHNTLQISLCDNMMIVDGLYHVRSFDRLVRHYDSVEDFIVALLPVDEVADGQIRPFKVLPPKLAERLSTVIRVPPDSAKLAWFIFNPKIHKPSEVRIID